MIKTLLFIICLISSIQAHSDEQYKELYNQVKHSEIVGQGIPNDATNQGTISDSIGQRELIVINIQCQGLDRINNAVLLNDTSSEFIAVTQYNGKLLFDKTKCHYQILPYKVLQ